MKQIRKGLFETNSSSVHAIAIKTANLNPNPQYPEVVTFNRGMFGWVHDTLTTPNEKASYLYESLFCTDRNIEEFKDFATKALASVGVKARFDDNDSEYNYIDHGVKTIDFNGYILESPEHLLNFLFQDSFIETGNDNSDCCPSERSLDAIRSDYEVFIKGN